MRPYPLRFKPIYKQKAWGGRGLAQLLGRRLPGGVLIGESWEVSDHGGDVSIVDGGPWDGRSLHDLIVRDGEHIIGSDIARMPGGRFPLIVKLIDARERLSVQVHPPDVYAAAREGGEPGKTEIWYSLAADEGAKILCGLRRPIDKKLFQENLERGTLVERLRRFRPAAGDVFFVPAGRIHSIGAGNLILEIEQNSDITYRIYDWGRKNAGRPLHLEKAMDVVDFGDDANPLVAKAWRKRKGIRSAHLAECPYFRIEEMEISDCWASRRAGDRFCLVSVVRGKCILACGGAGETELALGDTVLLPAALGEYEIKAGEGGCALLHTEVP